MSKGGYTASRRKLKVMNRDIISRRLAFSASIFAIFILLAEYAGGLDYLLNIRVLEGAAGRFELSYGADASRPIKPSDKEWGPTLKLIKDYTRANLPKDKEPRVIARSQAVFSAQEPVGKGQIAQWTAPSTPILLLYKDWPGNTVPPEDYRIIGSIGDLRSWIDQYQEKWKFRINDLLFALLGLITTALSLGGETEKPADGETDREPELLNLC
jgi:hypothetical protein